MRLVGLLLLLAGCATAAAPARRESAAKPTAPPPAVAEVPEAEAQAPYGTVDLDERDAPLSRVLARIADVAEVPIVASVSTETTATLSLHRAPWRDALDYVVLAYHLKVKRSGRYLVVQEKPRVHLEAQGADASSWFLLLAKQGGFSIVLPGNLRGTVDADLQDVGYEEALRATAREQGLELEPVK